MIVDALVIMLALILVESGVVIALSIMLNRANRLLEQRDKIQTAREAKAFEALWDLERREALAKLERHVARYPESKL